VEFVTPLSHDEDRVDAYHDSEPLRYCTVVDILGGQPVPGPVPHDVEVELHLTYDDVEPRSLAKAEKHAAWHAAMKAEVDAVEKNGTWELVDLPPGHRAITLKWVFKVKKDEAGALVKHKARLVARGFVQHEGSTSMMPSLLLHGWSPCVFSSHWQPRRLVCPSHGREVGVPQRRLEGGLRPPAVGIRDPRHGG
jgi:hypothetical protein